MRSVMVHRIEANSECDGSWLGTKTAGPRHKRSCSISSNSAPPRDVPTHTSGLNSPVIIGTYHRETQLLKSGEQQREYQALSIVVRGTGRRGWCESCVGRCN